MESMEGEVVNSEGCDQATTHAANTDINLAEQEPVLGVVNGLDEEQHVEESFGDQASAVSAGYHPEEVPLLAVVNPSHQAVTRPEAREAPAHQQPVECEIEVEIEHVDRDNYQEVTECNSQSGQQGAANVLQLAVKIYSQDSLDTPGYNYPVPEWNSYSPPLYRVRFLGHPGETLYPRRTSSGQEYILWEINDFDMHLRDTLGGRIQAIESPVMKMGRNYGYNYCILIFPKGTYGEDGNHMSVFVRMMPGEENDNLSWPFRGSFIITLVHQSGSANPQNHSRTIQTINNLVTFQQPPDAPTRAARSHRQHVWLYGYAKFARTDEVCSHCYRRGGGIKFKVETIPRT